MSKYQSRVAILIPAAGSSSRMRGRDKLMELIDGQTLLARMVGIAVASGCRVSVSLPSNDTSRHQALAGCDVELIDVADASSGMSASLRTWERTKADDVDGVAIMLADMPEITGDDLQLMLAQFDRFDRQKIIRATDSENRLGHPVIFPKRLFRRFAGLTGDRGAKELLRSQEVVCVALPDRHATTDLDTPEQWALWRKSTEGNMT